MGAAGRLAGAAAAAGAARRCGRYLAPNYFEDQSGEPEELIEEGGRILVAARMRARAGGSGIELDQVVYHLFTVKGSRAVRFAAYIDRREALAALRES
jgi:ketosteroid isomerase-like protein